MRTSGAATLCLLALASCEKDAERAHGFAVLSVGPDGKGDTADDIRSWD
jgi:hypothetical protein